MAKMQLAVGLDAGSSRTRCVIYALEGNQIRCLSYGLAVSAGWTKGRVSDQQADGRIDPRRR
jgi:N-acetylglucosamine kinase-like BadF-type ATPase